MGLRNGAQNLARLLNRTVVKRWAELHPISVVAAFARNLVHVVVTVPAHSFLQSVLKSEHRWPMLESGFVVAGPLSARVSEPCARPLAPPAAMAVGEGNHLPFELTLLYCRDVKWRRM